MFPTSASLNVPGRLFANPANLISPPFGGTALGLVKALTLLPGKRRRVITAEEHGHEISEVIENGELVVATFVTVGIDNEMADTLFPNTAVGGSGNRVISYPPTNVGTKGSDRSIVILFAPRNLTDHPAWILYKALPMLDETAEFQANLDEEGAWGGIFYGTRDATDRVYKQGKIGDLVL